MTPVEIVEQKGQIIAMILRSNAEVEGVRFFTPNSFSQQLGLLMHPKGTVIRPHVHKLITREVDVTQEVLLVQHGRIEVDLYDGKGMSITSCILNGGDVILLASGGHGIRVLEDAKIVEVKQGPYVGFDDKEYL